MNLNEKPTNDTGIVVNIQDDFAFVEVEKGEICNTCKLRYLCPQAGGVDEITTFKIKNILNAKKGDKISFVIEPKIRILSSFLVYVIPITLLISSYCISKHCLHLSENLSILIAILSVVLCFFILKFIDRIFSKKNIINPKMISILR